MAVEQLGGHDEHRQVDHAGEAHGDHHVDALEAHDLAALAVVDGLDARLRERGVQVDDVRHHRRAEDADGDHHAVGALEGRHQAAGHAARVDADLREVVGEAEQHDPSSAAIASSKRR